MADLTPEKNGDTNQSHVPVPGLAVPKKPKRNKFAFACSILASMTSILLGYDTGVMSGAIIYIKDDLKVSDVKLEILVGTINIYALAGSAVAGRTSDWIGRRYTIVLAGAIFFAGAFLMGFAPNYAFLMFGRFVAGIGVGYALMIAPVYTAEVSPAASRGFLTSFPEVFINAGVLLGYVSNYAFSKLPLNLGWRFMLGVGAIPSVVLAVGVLAMPESPRWLVMQGRLGDAKKVLNKTSDQHPNQKLTWAVALCIAMTLSCVAFFSIGMGPIAWVYSSEIFPLRLRAQGCSIGVAVNRVVSGVILMTFISLYKAITIGGAFFLFAGVATVAWIFFYTLLPETRGRTLEDMDVLFGTFCGWRSTMRELEKKRTEGNSDGVHTTTSDQA
ncbi:polyol transporter 1 [Olea europaea subsp. europaea]|uniref:Polyol transporter 1 n=1 Tax=Olea europaea subsp. europaea TaxID=158383 RepID=A0A8S0UAL5_OLEEU|nr:polyol transporter 1 [Olea europaea subsp. europaea]